MKTTWHQYDSRRSRSVVRDETHVVAECATKHAPLFAAAPEMRDLLDRILLSFFDEGGIAEKLVPTLSNTYDGRIWTTPLYWDCECEQNFIHEKITELSCPICGADEEDSPDSRVPEVIGLLFLRYMDKAEQLYQQTMDAVEQVRLSSDDGMGNRYPYSSTIGWYNCNIKLIELFLAISSDWKKLRAKIEGNS